MANDILPILELEELIEIFEYPSARSARRAIHNGTFPVPIFKLANRTVAHVDAVELYFSEMRQASMTWLKDRYGIEPKAGDVPTSPRLEVYRKAGLKERLASRDPS
jgi:hypothetical protein